MSNKKQATEAPVDALTSESAKQRWEMFHRAIAHAKQSASESLAEDDNPGTDDESAPARLSIVR